MSEESWELIAVGISMMLGMGGPLALIVIAFAIADRIRNKKK